ncbi:MAG: HlyD family secretion protein [Vampirovibrionia bacterium]
MTKDKTKNEAVTNISKIFLRNLFAELPIIQNFSRRRLISFISIIGGISAFSLLFSEDTSLRAYITGDVSEVISPLDGIVSTSYAQTGELVDSNDLLIEINGSKRSRDLLEKALLKRDTIQTQIDRLQPELSFLLESSISSIKDQLHKTKSHIVSLESQYIKSKSLQDLFDLEQNKGAISLSDRLTNTSEFNSLKSELDYQKKLEQKLKLQLASSSKYMNNSSGNLPISAKSLSQHDLQISNHRLTLYDLNDQLDIMNREIQQIRSRNLFEFSPSFSALVLARRATAGKEVTKGANLLTLVNCESLRVEALFEPRQVRHLKPGANLSVYDKINNKKYDGVLLSKQWESIDLSEVKFSSVIFPASKSERVRLHISVPINQIGSNCPYGQPVRVEV